MQLQNIYSDNYLDKRGYGKGKFTIDLLNQAYRLKLIKDVDIYRVQAEVAEILRKTIIKFTGKQSSSIKVEAAEQIVNSIWYSIDRLCIEFISTEDISNILCENSLEDIYQSGFKLVEKDFEDTKEVYNKLKEEDVTINFESIAYKDTINYAFPDFFAMYNIEFSANNTMSMIDYPLAIKDDMTIEGVVYMKNYIESIFEENKFLSLIESSKIQELLDLFSEKNKLDYKVGIENIFSIVFSNIVFCCFIGKDFKELILSKGDFRYLESLVYRIRAENLEQAISFECNKALEKIINELGIIDDKLIKYLNKYKEVFMENIALSVGNKVLENMVIVDNDEGTNTVNTNAIIIDNGSENMDDKSFRYLYNSILRSDSIEEKIEIVLQNMNSIKDFIDILKSECLIEEEMFALLFNLGDIELSILGKFVFDGKIRYSKIDLLDELIEIDVKHLDEKWEEVFIKYIRSLSLDRIKILEEYINEKIVIE